MICKCQACGYEADVTVVRTPCPECGHPKFTELDKNGLLADILIIIGQHWPEEDEIPTELIQQLHERVVRDKELQGPLAQLVRAPGS